MWVRLAIASVLVVVAPAAAHPAEGPHVTATVGSSDPPTPAQTLRSAPARGVVGFDALLGAAVAAANDERYCDALFLFEALHARAPSPRSLYNAAEVAFAAGDRVRALDLYRSTQRLYPEFTQHRLIQQRADDVFRAMVRAGPGQACPARGNTCGDWLLQAEQCDDGNVVDGDGCDHTCTETRCGNGVVTTGEECDDGNGIDGDGCDQNCRASVCGNGVRAAAEECDDGNLVDGDGCDHTCTPTACGNGVMTRGEQCDDGNVVDGDGCDAGCRTSRCGNGVVTGLEQCDDGNVHDGDGCERDCTLTRHAAPVPGLVMAAVGGSALVVGGALVVVGTSPLRERGAAVGAVDAARATFSDDPAGSIANAQREQERINQADDAWTSWGMSSTTLGSVLAAIGLGGVGGGAWYAATNTEIGPSP